VAVKFDLYNNQGEGINSTGLYTNGAAPTNRGSVNLTGTGIDLHSGHVFHVGMTYNSRTLIVTITDEATQATARQAYRIAIPRFVGGTQAYVGFTGGTGGLTATQDILDWAYVATATLGGAAPRRSVSSAASPGQSPAATGSAGAFLSSPAAGDDSVSAARIAALDLLFTESGTGANLRNWSNFAETWTLFGSQRPGDPGKAPASALGAGRGSAATASDTSLKVRRLPQEPDANPDDLTNFRDDLGW
jgi:hypothetical protein